MNSVFTTRWPSAERWAQVGCRAHRFWPIGASIALQGTPKIDRAAALRVFNSSPGVSGSIDAVTNA